MAPMPARPTAPRPCIGFAHRGASADARENTLEAFRLALELGATLEDVASTVHAHPTLAEAFMEACKVALGSAVHALNRPERPHRGGERA